MGQKKLLLPRFCWAVLTIAIGGILVVGARKWFENVRSEARIEELVASEELILKLTPWLAKLGEAAQELHLPGQNSEDLFADQVLVRDIRADAAQETAAANAHYMWPIESKRSKIDSAQLDLWNPFFGLIARMEHAKFTLVRGRFDDTSRKQFDTDVKFSCAARTTRGNVLGIEANLEIRWQVTGDAAAGGANQWRVVEWHTLSMESRSAGQPMFADVLEQAIADPAARQRARESRHEKYVIRRFHGKHVALPDASDKNFFRLETGEQHPGLSVVDIDSDGWDDLYVMARWGNNQLWRNQGDGTFREVAAEYGLDIDSFCTSAAFADFDNDGDPDLFLGRSLRRSMYLVNEGGRFVDESATKVHAPLPAMTSSVAVADYNGDGLLDVYFGVYGVLAANELELAWKFLGTNEYLEFEARAHVSHPYLHRAAPPNVLLVNRGWGKFERAPESQQVAVWMTTTQATWSDCDEDGDPDLYVANDFGPDNLLRNDGAEGFQDVTASEGHPTMRGFGMGISFGDYDLDGQQDLYVSNMFSKAGMRITGQLPELDPSFARSVDGNRLYRRAGNRYIHVSGLEPPALMVVKAGWSWGGQFVDVDNDGYLDIYVPSGYFSAPKEVPNSGDL